MASLDGSVVLPGASDGSSSAKGHSREGYYAFLSGSDTTIPVVDNFVPALGNTIQKNDAISFRVRDDQALATVLVYVSYGSSRPKELVHDGTNYSFPYFGSRVALVSPLIGWTYSLQRTGGWPSSPLFTAVVVDRGGNLNA